MNDGKKKDLKWQVGENMKGRKQKKNNLNFAEQKYHLKVSESIEMRNNK